MPGPIITPFNSQIWAQVSVKHFSSATQANSLHMWYFFLLFEPTPALWHSILLNYLTSQKFSWALCHIPLPSKQETMMVVGVKQVRNWPLLLYTSLHITLQLSAHCRLTVTNSIGNSLFKKCNKKSVRVTAHHYAIIQNKELGGKARALNTLNCGAAKLKKKINSKSWFK